MPIQDFRNPKTPKNYLATLSAQNITDQYFLLPHLIEAGSLSVYFNGTYQREGEEFSTSTFGTVTKVSLLGDLATGGAYPLVNGSKLDCHYTY